MSGLRSILMSLLEFICAASINTRRRSSRILPSTCSSSLWLVAFLLVLVVDFHLALAFVCSPHVSHGSIFSFLVGVVVAGRLYFDNVESVDLDVGVE